MSEAIGVVIAMLLLGLLGAWASKGVGRSEERFEGDYNIWMRRQGWLHAQELPHYCAVNDDPRADCTCGHDDGTYADGHGRRCPRQQGADKPCLCGVDEENTP